MDRQVSRGLKLWGVGTARTLRAHWVLHELGLDYEAVKNQSRDGSTQTKEFLAMNPRGKIPLLWEGGLFLCESAAIVTHMGIKYHDRAMLVPGHDRPESMDFAKYLQWSFFVMTELDAHTLYIIRRHHRKGLAHLCGESPPAVEEAARGFKKQVQVCADLLSSGQPYLLGDTFSGVDILLTTSLTWAQRMSRYTGHSFFPKSMNDYITRCENRPAFRAARLINTPERALTDFA